MFRVSERWQTDLISVWQVGWCIRSPLPECPIKLEELREYGSSHGYGTFEPLFPADVATREDYNLPVHDDKFGMHDAER